MELGEPDASGRRRPVAVEVLRPFCRQRRHHRCRTTANPLIQSTTPDLKTNRWNYIVADEATMRTSKRGSCRRDIVTGGATVILAMGAGRKAAASIHDYLISEVWDAAAQQTV